MKRKWFLIGAVALGLLLALAVGMTYAQGPEPPDGEVQTQGDVSIVANVSSKISYQGVLKENGNPVNGTRTITFTLYSNSGCTTLVDTIVKNSVPITNGLFSVDLAVDQADFNGQALWLRATVGSTPIGCQEILPVPYALSLRPGARINGAPGATGALVAASTSDGSLGGSMVQGMVLTGAGIYGHNNLLSGMGVYGESTYAGLGYGVYGKSTSSGGYGVYGENTGGGRAGYFSGDVGQRRQDDGLVKAAVYAECGSSGSTVTRYFNNVNTSAITASDGVGAGLCTIDFNFTVNDRFWSTSVYGPLAQGVSCGIGASIDTLSCYRWSAGGIGVNGGIMIIVY